MPTPPSDVPPVWLGHPAPDAGATSTSTDRCLGAADLQRQHLARLSPLGVFRLLREKFGGNMNTCTDYSFNYCTL